MVGGDDLSLKITEGNPIVLAISIWERQNDDSLVDFFSKGHLRLMLPGSESQEQCLWLS